VAVTEPRSNSAISSSDAGVGYNVKLSGQLMSAKLGTLRARLVAHYASRQKESEAAEDLFRGGGGGGGDGGGGAAKSGGLAGEADSGVQPGAKWSGAGGGAATAASVSSSPVEAAEAVTAVVAGMAGAAVSAVATASAATTDTKGKRGWRYREALDWD